MSERQNFQSRLGVVLATAGSAVGLGNVWRFPYMTGENGGAAFLLLYVVCILMLGVPGMISEFIVGRHAQANAAHAYDQLSGGRPWRLVGYLGILTSTIILGFYAVVAGWCLQYLYASVVGQVQGDADYVKDYFAAFSSDPLKPVLWGIAFIVITHLVIVRGVRRGIEQASRWLMPILLILLVVLVVASCMLPGAVEGVAFLLKPDLSKLSGDVLLEALGQAFFSLSLGTACLCTYASYFSRDTNLLHSAGQIALLDTLIAILAGLMIFPAAAAVGISPDSGPSLIFITLPNVFQQAFGGMPAVGYVIGVMFYALLVFAALTSTISMHEIGTAFFTEEFHLPRRKSAWTVTTAASLLCMLCAWSVGAYGGLRLMGLSLMDFCDQLTANVMLPLGGMLACLFVGWYIPRRVVYEEFTNDGACNRRYYRVFLFFVRYVCPLCILLVFLHQLGVL
ncbi:MAG: sodium-dependent transporter [Prevotella sp.]|nr:sodium-dependent transporter [Prevotella sp.]MBQ9204364.1 sodium-dependent transporter [Prevotella sp.]